MKKQPSAPKIKGKAENKTTTLVQNAAAAFLAADVNGNMMLDFDEFKTLIPKELRKQGDEKELREIFDQADLNKNGEVSRDEFFFWTLSWAQNHAGISTAGIEELFRHHDLDNSGQLNLTEFTQVVESCGFGDIGHAIFNELDADSTGTISLKELQGSLKARRGNYSRECKQLLTAMSFSMLDHKEAPMKLHFKGERWSAENVSELRDEIRKRTMEQLGRPYDCWQALLDSAEVQRRLTGKQFCSAVKEALGYLGPPQVPLDAFAEMDDDSSGTVSYDEFMNWMTGRPQRRQVARSLSLETARGPEKPPLGSLVWTEKVLRAELQDMLKRTQVSALDLLMAYDKSDDGLLSKKEYLVMMKALVGNEDAWRGGAKDAALDTFENLSGKDKSMDIEELVRWLPEAQGKLASSTGSRGSQRRRSSLRLLELPGDIGSAAISTLTDGVNVVSRNATAMLDSLPGASMFRRASVTRRASATRTAEGADRRSNRNSSADRRSSSSGGNANRNPKLKRSHTAKGLFSFGIFFGKKNKVSPEVKYGAT